MKVELSDELAEELRVTVGDVVSEMSGEIADTDNAGYRRGLQARRERLRSILGLLAPGSVGVSSAGAPAGGHS